MLECIPYPGMISCGFSRVKSDTPFRSSQREEEEEEEEEKEVVEEEEVESNGRSNFMISYTKEVCLPCSSR